MSEHFDPKALSYLLRLVLLHRAQVCKLTNLISSIILAIGVVFLATKGIELAKHGARLWDAVPLSLWSGCCAMNIRTIWLNRKMLKRLNGADRIFKEFLESGTGNTEQLQGATQTTLG